MNYALTKLVRQVREALEGRGDVAGLAAEYARLGREAVLRLEQCAEMLAKGSELQALQVAEVEPALMDVISALSFAEAPQWVGKCQGLGLPVPPAFDPKAVQMLNTLYAKGIAPNHPLYKEYRAAVSSRDDVGALRIVRSIVRLNPADTNAAAELRRLEAKLFREALGVLHTALGESAKDGKDGEDAVLRAVEEVERLGTPAQYLENADYQRGADLRRGVERAAAETLCGQLLEGLPHDRRAGLWNEALRTVERIEALRAGHRITLPPAATGLCEESRAWALGRMREERAQSQFEAQVQLLRAFVEQSENRLLARSSLEVAELEEMLTEMGRMWGVLEHGGRPVPEELVGRVRRASDSVRLEIGRLHRQKRLRAVSTVVLVAGLLSAGIFFAVRFYRERDERGRLEELRANRAVDGAEKLVEKLRADGVAERPTMRVAVEEAAAWVAGERAKLGQAVAELGKMEEAVGGDLGVQSPSQWAAQLKLCVELVEAVAPGLRAAPDGRLTVLRNRLDAHFTAMREVLAQQASKEVEEVDQMVAEGLGFEREEDALRAALEAIQPRLRGLEGRLEPPIEALAIPAALQTRIRTARQRVDVFVQELEQVAAGSTAMRDARTLEAYREALGRFEKSRLVRAKAVVNARTLLPVFPEVAGFLPKLLLPDDAEAWVAAKGDLGGGRFLPQKVLDPEVSALLRIRQDKNLDEVYVHKLVRRKSGNATTVTAYSRGVPQALGGMINGESRGPWKGSFFIPDAKSTSALFMDDRLTPPSDPGRDGDELKDRKPGEAMVALAALQLNRMTDANGQVYERSLMHYFEVLSGMSGTSAAVRAVLWQQLMGLLKIRPYEWGLQHSAQLRRDLLVFDRLVQRERPSSADWMIPVRSASLNECYGAFFKKVASRKYLQEAQVHRDIVRAVIGAGLRYGGFVDEAGVAQLLPEAAVADALWGVGEGVNTAAVGVRPGGEVKGVRVFSPLFFVPLDRRTFGQTKQQDTVPPSAAAPVIPFLSVP